MSLIKDEPSKPMEPAGERAREREDRASICIFIPVCEPPRELVGLVQECDSVLRASGRDYEFLIVAEPWAKSEVEPLVRLAQQGERISVLEVGQDIGESMLLRAAVAYRPANVIITLPPYPRVALDGILDLLNRLDAGADLAVARRETWGTPWPSRIQRRALHWFLEKGTGSGYGDIGSGVRAMRRTVLEEVPLHGDLYRFLPLLADRAGFRVEEVRLAPHPKSDSKKFHSPGTYVRRALDLLGLLVLVRFTQKPLRFFGLVGGLVGASGGAILLVLLVQRLEGQALADRPLLLLGVMLFVLGVQVTALGLLGEIIVHLGSEDRPVYRLASESSASNGGDELFSEEGRLTGPTDQVTC